MTPTTINGTITDAEANPLAVAVTFTTLSTPQGSGVVVEANSAFTVNTNPSTGQLTIALLAGVYQVVITAQGTDPSTTFQITVGAGPGTVNLWDIVSSPVTQLPGAPPNTLFNGELAGDLTFLPLAAPTPTYSEVTYTGGTIDTGASYYTYFISYVNALGETICGAKLDAHDSLNGTGGNANRALQVAFGTPPAGVTTVHIWRTYVDPGSGGYTNFPANVGLLATVAPTAGFYNDFETNALFAARVTATAPPVYNTTSGQVCSSPGKVAMVVTDEGIEFPGTCTRIDPKWGLQIYNTTTGKWYTLLNFGNPAQWGLDAGNSSYNQSDQ